MTRGPGPVSETGPLLSSSMLEIDIERFVRDNTFAEIWEGRAKDMEASLVEYQDCVFQVNLKEEEIKVRNESLQYQARDSDELQSKLKPNDAGAG
jgi:kinesin family member 15